MHFLDGRITAENDKLHFVAGAIRLRVPDAATATLKCRIDAPIVLGLRPEAIRLADANEANGQLITATVRISEVLGDRVFHRIETPDGQALIVQGARSSATLSETAHLFQVNPSGMKFFAPGPFGERL